MIAVVDRIGIAKAHVGKRNVWDGRSYWQRSVSMGNDYVGLGAQLRSFFSSIFDFKSL